MVDYVYWIEDGKPSKPLPSMKMMQKQAPIIPLVSLPHVPNTHRPSDGNALQKAAAYWKDPELIFELFKENMVPHIPQNHHDGVQSRRPLFVYHAGLMSKVFGKQKTSIQPELLEHMETPAKLRAQFQAPIIVSMRRPLIQSQVEGFPTMASLLTDSFEPYAFI